MRDCLEAMGNSEEDLEGNEIIVQGTGFRRSCAVFRQREAVTTENMEENSASAGLKDSGELRKCFQDSLPLNYLNFRSQSTAVIHKFCQGYTSNLLCSSSITVLLSCHYIAQCFTFYFYCIQINH